MRRTASLASYITMNSISTLLVVLAALGVVAASSSQSSMHQDVLNSAIVRLDATDVVVDGRHVIRNSTIPSMKDATVAAFDWPGVQVKASVTGLHVGSTISVRMHWHHIPCLPKPSGYPPFPFRNRPSMFRVVLTKASDPSTAVSTMNFTTANQGLNNTEVFSYEVVSGVQFDPTETYNIDLTKLTESDYSMPYFTKNFVEFFSFDVHSSSSQRPVPIKMPAANLLSRRRIDFYGDSITCGFANMCKSFPSMNATEQCRLFELEDITLTWGSRTCDALSTGCRIMCYSSLGMYRNAFGGPDTLPQLANRSVATDNTTVFSQPPFASPDVIAINLGANDHLKPTTPAPVKQAFVDKYISFVHQMNALYGGNITFVLACPPWPQTHWDCAEVVKVLHNVTTPSAAYPAVKAHYLDLRPLLDNPTCCGHPDVHTHQKMANAAVALIQRVMKW